MKIGPDFLAYLQDLFGALGVVRAKPLFGGVGLYIDELMFGFLDRDETIYLRADDENRPAFQAAGSNPFRYPLKSGEEFEIGYWRMPEEALEQPELAAQWARGSLEAAMRKRADKETRRVGRGRTRGEP